MPEATIPNLVLGNNTKIPILGLAAWGWSVSFFYIKCGNRKINVVDIVGENVTFRLIGKHPGIDYSICQRCH